MAHVLVLGATGYVGRHLVPRLAGVGHTVRCLARNPDKVDRSKWPQVEILSGDALNAETLPAAMAGMDIVYYLIHSMSSGEKFEDLDRLAATNAGSAASKAGVKRLIYLGGLGKKGADQSPHLRSRHETADTLRGSGVPVTEFRAAVVAGAEGLSFEMVHHLVNRLPVMICPRWVNIKTQPIAIDDVIRYLSESIDIPETTGKVIDIGGPEVLTYRDMMLTVARVLRLRRLLIRVPVLTPRLSSYWVKLVTPLPFATARALIESVRSETIRENNLADTLFNFEPMTFEAATKKALARVLIRPDHEGKKISTESMPAIDPSHLLRDKRENDSDVSVNDLFAEVSAIGGENGWYYADWLWRLRGAIDKLLGGVGLRRGRPQSGNIKPGEALDFWRVEKYIPNEKMVLRAEMNVWGEAWLSFIAMPRDDGGSRLIQEAIYYPRGLFGLIYWYTVYPVHVLVFKGMAKAIVRRVEARVKNDRHCGEGAGK